MSPRRPIARFVATALLAAAVSTAALAPGAGAAPVDKQQQAAQLQDQIEAADVQISGLAQQLAASEAARDSAQQTAADAQAQIDRAKAEVDRILGIVRGNLASLYRRTLTGNTVTGMDFSEASDLVKRGRYVEAQSARDQELLSQLEVAQDDLAVQREEAERARDDAAAQAAGIAATKASIETARADQQKLLDGIKGELAAAVAAERARREAAVKVKFSSSVAFPNVGPPNGSAGQAIAYARAIAASGASYCTGGNGPDCYDCSGLVTAAWGSAGVGLPGRSSGAMYSNLPHVPMESIQPGDLIFWGAGGSSHVGLYVGGGSIVDASSSQNGVVERGIWGSPVGAARVT
jgi:cell wall-associated NlpC family hydrolase